MGRVVALSAGKKAATGVPPSAARKRPAHHPNRERGERLATLPAGNETEEKKRSTANKRRPALSSKNAAGEPASAGGKGTMTTTIEAGSTHWIRHRENFPCLAEVIEIRTKEGGEPGHKEYYVHYCNFDKRLDEWVDADRFLTPEQTSEFEQTRMTPATTGSTIERTLTRNMRRKFEESSQGRPHQRAPLADPVMEQLEKEHEAVTKVRNIQHIILGKYDIDCWYFSPYPDEYCRQDQLYICENCLKYMKFEATYVRHQNECMHNSPPGKMIYMKDNLAAFEIDGETNKLYCQNLCLIAKLFLDHKTLYYDVSPFYFYVLCELDEDGTHPVGYFSKEKESADDYNLACIMILPPYQKNGYGRFLIQLSYEITKRERKTGTPERPLSDLGALSYKSFWAYELLHHLKRLVGYHKVPTVDELLILTGFKREDIMETLNRLKLTRLWRGQPVISVTTRTLDEHLRVFEGKRFTLLDPECLNWPL